MNVKSCYDSINGDYEGVISRLKDEKRVHKFLCRFPSDGNFILLQTSLAIQNSGVAFRAAHSLKGIAMNLGFTRLEKSATRLTDELRNQPDYNVVNEIFAEVNRDYQQIIYNIKLLDEC